MDHVITAAWSRTIHGKPDYSLKQKIKSLKDAIKSICKSPCAGPESKVCSLRKEKEKWDYTKQRAI